MIAGRRGDFPDPAMSDRIHLSWHVRFGKTGLRDMFQAASADICAVQKARKIGLYAHERSLPKARAFE
jgi:hypothetical protein